MSRSSRALSGTFARKTNSSGSKEVRKKRSSKITRTPTELRSSRDKSKSEPRYMEITDPPQISKILKELRLDEDIWNHERKAYHNEFEQLGGPWYEEDIPSYFLRTACIAQYCNDSVLVLYKRTNSKKQEVYKLIEYIIDGDNHSKRLWEYPESKDRNEVLSNFCDHHKLAALKGKIVAGKDVFNV